MVKLFLDLYYFFLDKKIFKRLMIINSNGIKLLNVFTIGNVLLIKKNYF